MSAGPIKLRYATPFDIYIDPQPSHPYAYYAYNKLVNWLGDPMTHRCLGDTLRHNHGYRIYGAILNEYKAELERLIADINDHTPSGHEYAYKAYYDKLVALEDAGQGESPEAYAIREDPEMVRLWQALTDHERREFTQAAIDHKQRGSNDP